MYVKYSQTYNSEMELTSVDKIVDKTVELMGSDQLVNEPAIINIDKLIDTIAIAMDEYEVLLGKRLYSSTSLSQDRKLDSDIIRKEEGLNIKLKEAINSITKGSNNWTVSNEHEKRVLETKLNEQKLKLQTIAEKYYNVKKDFIDKQTKVLKRSYLTINPTANKEQVDSINYTDHILLFDSTFDTTTTTSDIKNMYEQIRNKHNDILKLEADIRYLQQLFITADILIKNQGEIIIQIENNIDVTVTNTTLAVTDLKYTNQLQSARRKKLICLLVTMTIIIIVIVVPTVVTMTNKQH